MTHPAVDESLRHPLLLRVGVEHAFGTRRSEVAAPRVLAQARQVHGAVVATADAAGGVVPAFADAVDNHAEHRSLLSSMLKRTRLFVVQPAKFNDPATTGGQEEVGYRYLEGASAGAILVGHAPSGGDFAAAFPWPDAVVELPLRGAADVVLDLLRGPDDEARRRRSVAHCLRHHDWVYRVEVLLKHVGQNALAAASSEAIDGRREYLASAARAIISE